MALDIAARVSCGSSWPDAPQQPQDEGNVLILAAYDPLLATAAARFRQAGSNPERTFFSDGLDCRQPASANGLRRRFRFPDDIQRLERTIVEHNPMKLVVIDPIWAFCGAEGGRRHGTDPATLAALAKLAADFDVAIVGVTGLRRTTRGVLGYQVVGDRGLVAAARAAWGIVRHPGKDGLRVLLPIKMNIGPDQPGLNFRIVEGRIEWEEKPTKLTPHAAIAAERSAGRRDGAAEWLRSYLSAGGRPAKEILQQAKECGLSRWGIEQAKSVVGISVQKNGFNGDTHWRWSLDDPCEEENGKHEIAQRNDT